MLSDKLNSRTFFINLISTKEMVYIVAFQILNLIQYKYNYCLNTPDVLVNLWMSWRSYKTILARLRYIHKMNRR